MVYSHWMAWMSGSQICVVGHPAAVQDIHWGWRHLSHPLIQKYVSSFYAPFYFVQDCIMTHSKNLVGCIMFNFKLMACCNTNLWNENIFWVYTIQEIYAESDTMYNNLELSKSNTATPYHGNIANHRQLHDYLKYEKRLQKAHKARY